MGTDWKRESSHGRVSDTAARQTEPIAKNAHADADARERECFGDDSGGCCGVSAGLTLAVAFFDVGCVLAVKRTKRVTLDLVDLFAEDKQRKWRAQQMHAHATIPAPQRCRAFVMERPRVDCQ